MARGKWYQTEQVVNLLRQIEVSVANGKTTARRARKRGSWSRHISVGARSMAGFRWIRAKREETAKFPPLIETSAAWQYLMYHQNDAGSVLVCGDGWGIAVEQLQVYIASKDHQCNSAE